MTEPLQHEQPRGGRIKRFFMALALVFGTVSVEVVQPLYCTLLQPSRNRIDPRKP